MSVQIQLQSVTKSFHTRKSIFAPVSSVFSSNDIIAITGSNGTGKSTLLKIIAKALQPSSGSCNWTMGGINIEDDAIYPRLGFSAPYLHIYDEFTALEHCKLNCDLLSVPFVPSRADDLFLLFGLSKRKGDIIKTFSSGMKQRVKLILALQHSPDVLLLDEPTTNMDSKGIDTLYSVLEEEKKRSALIILATNEQRDIDCCSSILPVIPLAI